MLKQGSQFGGAMTENAERWQNLDIWQMIWLIVSTVRPVGSRRKKSTGSGLNYAGPLSQFLRTSSRDIHGVETKNCPGSSILLSVHSVKPSTS